jgi:hypothetical protein
MKGLKTLQYNRSEIISFYELTEAQQIEAVNMTDRECAENDSYVIYETGTTEEALPLSMFMRTDDCKNIHGIYGLTYGSAYAVTLSRSGDSAIVSYQVVP